MHSGTGCVNGRTRANSKNIEKSNREKQKGFIGEIKRYRQVGVWWGEKGSDSMEKMYRLNLPSGISVNLIFPAVSSGHFSLGFEALTGREQAS